MTSHGSSNPVSIRSTFEHALALLDMSCVIEFPDQMDELAHAAAVSALTIAELAYGIHHHDPAASSTPLAPHGRSPSPA